MNKPVIMLLAALAAVATVPSAKAWDHGGHMTSAAIAFSEIERQRPELASKLGMLLVAHSDPGPFSVAAGDSKGMERFRRTFVECSRWPDDIRFTAQDQSAWHTARWPVIADDAPPEARAAARHGDRPAGQAIEALQLNYAVFSSPEAKSAEAARSLCWLLHLVGDIHEPMHASDYYSRQYPGSNLAGSLAYVADPVDEGTLTLHMLWDSNTLRTSEYSDIEPIARQYMERFPRSSLPELAAHDGPADFLAWARESYQLAVDFAYGQAIETVSDPNQEPDADRVVKNMIRWVIEGVSPVAEAPEVPAAYWEELQRQAMRRITLAGYRLADAIIAADDHATALKAPINAP